MVFVGPSGCGKSTLLRMIAGLEDITEGEIDLDGKTINKIDPSDRDIAMVFQNYALYPHMSVYKNLSYGLKNKGESKEIINKKVNEVAELLEIKEYLQRKPAQLSGGQRQRVAMGRAIVRNPKVFLFDEPLSNLDAKLRGQVRIQIKKLQQSMNVTSVFVTHDQVEAMTLGDRMAVINEGVIEQIGTPIEVYEKPKSKFVAEFIGSPQMNFINGTIKNNNFESKGLKLNIDLNIDNANVALGFRADDLEIKEDGEISLNIDIIEKLGSDSIIYGRDKNGESICYKESGNTKLGIGENINISINVDNVHIFDEKKGKRLN
jgi:sn-glycerol 3-phosphate transport system ATP-binding protein